MLFRSETITKMKGSMSQVDTHPTPPPPGFFKGRIQKSKYMDYRKNTDDPKGERDADDHLPNLKQKRVFGTQRNTNVVVKPKIDKKSTPKSQGETAQKQSKSIEKTDTENVKQEVSENDSDAKVLPEVMESNEVESNRIEETEMKPKKKKSVGFQEKTDNDNESSASASAVASAPRTPVQLSSSLRKPLRSGTPYHTAKNCRRCKIDKLETSSYWIEQIKLSESVGKHFVSIKFFLLAHRCNAEPIRSLKMELKRYLMRHGDLCKEKEWIEAMRRYGLHVSEDDDDGDEKSGGEMVKSEDEVNVVICNDETEK